MDTILFNGNIHTLDHESPRAEALLIRDGFIHAVGNNSDVLAQASPDAERIDLGGRLVLPGFTDSHMHVVYYASLLRQVSQIGRAHV